MQRDQRRGRLSDRAPSPSGALDMAGNAWEWCLTRWREDSSSPASEDPAGDAARAVRGRRLLRPCVVWCAAPSGSWDLSGPPGTRVIGFRVVAPPVIHDAGL